MYVVIGVAIFFLIDPFNLLTPQAPGVGRRFERETVTALSDLYDDIAVPIEDYLVRSMSTHDVVFLGYFDRIREPIVNLAAAIPALHRAGYRNLGVDLLLARDQDRIDALLTAPGFDSEEAERLLFNALVVRGYQEYVDLLEAAWRVNNEMGAGPGSSDAFRVVGLAVNVNYQVVQTEEDAQDPEVLRRLFTEGVPDAEMARVILEDFVDQGEKILVFVPLQHALGRFTDEPYRENAQEAGVEETRRTARIVYETIGSRSTSIMFHNPVPSDQSAAGVDYPTGGTIDAVVAAKEGPAQFRGFSVVGNGFGELRLPRSRLAPEEEQEVRLADVTSGYIVTGPIRELDAVTPIPDFYTTDNIQEAMDRFPGPKEEGLAPGDMNRFLTGMSENLDRMLNSFQ